MSNPFLIVSREKGLAIVTLNRPEKRNAMNGAMIQELDQLLIKMAQDQTVKVLLIKGNGEHFCAGADISWMKTIGTQTKEDNQRDAEALANLLHHLYEFPKPTIAVAQGAVLGGGMGILSVCDIAIAADNCNFGFPEVKIGIAPSTISPYVIAAMGERAAHYYFLTGNRFGSEEAMRIGLVHQVTEAAALYQTGHALAKTLLQNGPAAMTAIKQLIHRVANEKISPALIQYTAQHLASLRTSAEAQEGLNAFLEKRAPQWVEGP